jgi:hypothetical protein
MARERRNVSSPARVPNVANASAHSVRAATCGHSSSHVSAVRPVRRRRSCATIASCHTASRADSDAASDVPMPEPSVTYGFMSDPTPRFRRESAVAPAWYSTAQGCPQTLLALAGDAPGIICAAPRSIRVRRTAGTCRLAGAAASVPRGIGATASEESGCLLVTKAPPTPPQRWRARSKG